MKNYEILSHTRYDCKYHVVFIPKYRRKKIYGAIRRHLGEIFHEVAKQKESRILEGHLKGGHVHMCISIPPKFAVSSVVCFMKGKSAISIARNFLGRKRNFTGESFWARGYFVSASCCRRAILSRASSRRALKAEMRARTNDEIKQAWCRQTGERITLVPAIVSHIRWSDHTAILIFPNT